MAVDIARCRNRVSPDLWNDFSIAPYHKEFEPKMINGTRGEFVEVILNGNYHGIYCMTERVDRKQLKLKKFEENPENIRGVLYKSAQWGYEVFMGFDQSTGRYPGTQVREYNNLSETWGGWEMQYPDLEDVSVLDWYPLYRGVNLVASGSDVAFKSLLNKCFDMPLFRDYFIFIELLLAKDNYGKNMFMYCYNKNSDLRLSLTPWDLDGTWGRNWNSSPLHYTDKENVEYTMMRRLKGLKFEN